MRYKAVSYASVGMFPPSSCNHLHPTVAFAEECRERHGMDEVRQADGSVLSTDEMKLLYHYCAGRDHRRGT